MSITPLNIDTYSEFIKSRRVVLIHFWADWNTYDKTVKAYLVRIAAAYVDHVHLGSVDVSVDVGDEELRQLVQELGIKGVPTIILYKDGTLVEKVVGMLPAQQIENKLVNRLES